MLERLHCVILTSLAYLLANVEHIPGGVVAGRTDRTADQLTIEILFLNLIQIVVVKQHFAFLACSNRRVIVRVLFFHLVRNGTHSLNSRKHRLGIVNGVPVFVLEPVHVLTQFIKRLCLVRIKALVIIIRPLLRARQRRLAEQHSLRPISRTLAVLRELQDLLAVLVQTVAAARIYGCRALKRLLYSTAAERQQQVRRRVGRALCRVKRNALVVVAVLIFLFQLAEIREGRGDRHTAAAEQTADKRNLFRNIFAKVKRNVHAGLFVLVVIVVQSERINDHADRVKRRITAGQLVVYLIKQISTGKNLSVRPCKRSLVLLGPRQVLC